ncbi:hypothetical protein [Vibrio harveyi]|uniref:hypothetical protein n=1 Tax=Vibrio harveyi TaxID=669 RepID=UPI0018F155D0|nr:hypothetical protein [Vibrio harveyi]
MLTEEQRTKFLLREEERKDLLKRLDRSMKLKALFGESIYDRGAIKLMVRKTGIGLFLAAWLEHADGHITKLSQEQYIQLSQA